jgi:hypothetical protein
MGALQMKKCPSGKTVYHTETLAEEGLIELWTKNDYPPNRGPMNVYRCDDCGFFHLTSREPMNPKLAQYLSSDKGRINREASKWLDKFKNK